MYEIRSSLLEIICRYLLLMFPSLFAVTMKGGDYTCTGTSFGITCYHPNKPKTGHVCDGSKSTNKHHLKMELGCYEKTMGVLFFFSFSPYGVQLEPSEDSTLSERAGLVWRFHNPSHSDTGYWIFDVTYVCDLHVRIHGTPRFIVSPGGLDLINSQVYASTSLINPKCVLHAYTHGGGGGGVQSSPTGLPFLTSLLQMIAP